MKIDEMINALFALKAKVGGNEEVPFVTTTGENDYINAAYPIVGEFEDQDGNEFKCAFLGHSGGEEFTQKGIPHYDWKPADNELKYENLPIKDETRFDGYVRIDAKFPEPTIVDMSGKILKIKMKYAYPPDADVNGDCDSEAEPLIPGYDEKDQESIKWNIDPESGVILNWVKGTTAKTNYKIVDMFEYDYDGFHYDNYVPDFMGIDDKGWGDYVCVTVDENGKIKGWDKDRFLKEHKKLVKESQED